MKYLSILFALFFLTKVTFSQENTTWFERKIAFDISYENQFALNENTNLQNMPISVGYKLTPRWNIKYCSALTTLLSTENKTYERLYNYGLALNYQILFHEKPNNKQLQMELETKFLYGYELNSSQYDNFNYNINLKFIPAYYPYFFAGVGIHHYLSINSAPDIICGFVSFGIRY
jgi:hypothetical protein